MPKRFDPITNPSAHTKAKQEEFRKRREAKKARESGVIIEPKAPQAPQQPFDRGRGNARVGSPTPAPQAPQVQAPKPRTVQQRAESMLFGEQERLEKLGGRLFDESPFDKPTGSLLENEVNQLVKQQKRDSEELRRNNDLADNRDQETIRQAERSAAGSNAGVSADLSAGREGPSSAGNVAVKETFVTENNARIEGLVNQAEAARQSRRNAEARLAEAQKNGKQAMVRAAQAALDNAENQIKQIDADLLNAQRASSEEARAVQAASRQNLDQFINTIESGVTLTPEAINGLASQLNVDTGLAAEYYLGAESIRQNKQLSLEEQQLKLGDLKIDLQRKAQGKDDERVRRLDYIDNLYNNGASQSEIDRAMEAFGMTTNRVMDAEARIQEATARIKEIEASGQPLPGSPEYYDLQLKKLEVLKEEALLSDTLGGEYDFENMETRLISGGASNGSGRVDPTTLVSGFDFGTGKRNQQLKDDQGNVIGRISSPYGADHSKISGEKVHNGIDIVFENGNVRALEGGKIVKTGVAPKTYGGYVWIADGNGQVMQYGHLDVEQVQNLQLGQTVNSGDIFIQHETEKGKQGASSGAHADVRFVGQGKRSPLKKPSNKAFLDAAGSLQTNFGDKVGVKFNDDLQRRLKEGDEEGAKELIKVAVRNTAPAETQKQIGGAELGFKLISNIKSDLKAFEDAGGETSLFNGTAESVKNKIGETGDPELAKLATKIQATIQNYRKAISGAAFTESESKEYEKIFPNTSKTKVLNMANIEALEDVFNIQLETFYSNAIGETAYKGLFPKPKKQLTDQERLVNAEKEVQLQVTPEEEAGWAQL